MSVVWCQRPGVSGLVSAICCYLRRRNLRAIFIVAASFQYLIKIILPLPAAPLLPLGLVRTRRYLMVITHWHGHQPQANGTGHRPPMVSHRPRATGQRPLFIYSFFCLFLMGFSSVVFIYLLFRTKEVDTLGGSFSACELGTKVPTPRVLKQPLNRHISYPPTIPHTVEFRSCLRRCAWHG